MKLLKSVFLLNTFLLLFSCQPADLEIQSEDSTSVEIRSEIEHVLWGDINCDNNFLEALLIYNVMMQSEVGLSPELQKELDDIFSEYSIIEEELIIEGTIATMELIGDVIKIVEDGIVITYKDTEADVAIIWGIDQEKFTVSLKKGGEAIAIVYRMATDEPAMVNDLNSGFEDLINKIEDQAIQDYYSTLFKMFLDRIERIRENCL